MLSFLLFGNTEKQPRKEMESCSPHYDNFIAKYFFPFSFFSILKAFIVVKTLSSSFFLLIILFLGNIFIAHSHMKRIFPGHFHKNCVSFYFIPLHSIFISFFSRWFFNLICVSGDFHKYCEKDLIFFPLNFTGRECFA